MTARRKNGVSILVVLDDALVLKALTPANVDFFDVSILVVLDDALVLKAYENE